MHDVQAALARLLQALPAWEESAARVALARRLHAEDTDPQIAPDALAALLAANCEDLPTLVHTLDAIADDLAHGPGPTGIWPLGARWAEGEPSAVALAACVQRDAQTWAARHFPPHDWWPDELLRPARRLLARAALLQDLERDPVLADFLTPEPDRLLAELACHSTDDGRREDIGLRLAGIGDPRAGVLPEHGCPRPCWRALPGGTVTIDGRRTVTLKPLRLSAYPVTQAQYDAFLAAPDGFANPTWWSGLHQRPPDPRRGAHRCNYPVTGVSWHDATAYCRWLSAQLGMPVRLPREAEWQWAAQGARADFLYPWGTDWLPGHANTDETGIGRTIAVGMYPSGHSPQGVADLAGNIWEWCQDSFDPRDPHRATRVIRGGSWRVNRGFARADFRLDAGAEDRVGSTGFRLAADGAGSNQ